MRSYNQNHYRERSSICICKSEWKKDSTQKFNSSSYDSALEESAKLEEWRSKRKVDGRYE